MTTPQSEQTTCAAPLKRQAPSRYRRVVGAVKYWLFLNIWCRHLYRHVMRFMHRFNIHHAQPSPMNPQFGKQEHWCQWCGLRGTTYKPDPSKGINFAARGKTPAK